MEIHIEVQDNKAEMITKLLEHMPFVKIKCTETPQEQQPTKPVDTHQQGKDRQLTLL
jgi:hypothetical protein